MKSLSMILAFLLVAAVAVVAKAQCNPGRVDQTNLLLGQQLTQGSVASSSTGCTSCQRGQALTAVPAPQVQMFTLPTPPAKKYVLAEVEQPQSQVLYMTAATAPALPSASTSASSSAGSASAAASSSASDFSLPLVATLPPQQSLTLNSTACNSNGCGRAGLIRRAFSGFGSRRQVSRSVSRSFTSTTVN